MLCRHCSHRMGQKILRGQLLDICAACGGLWLDRSDLGALLATPRAAANAEALHALQKDLEWSVSYDGAPARPCPHCGKNMLRHLFAALSGIAVDCCAAHGIWCDPGEFERLADFVERGGFQLARLQSWEEALPAAKDAGKKQGVGSALSRVLSVVSGAAALGSKK